VTELGQEGELVGLVEKPEHSPSDLALVGVYLIDAHVHDAVAAIAPSAMATWRSPTPSGGCSTTGWARTHRLSE